MPSSLKDSSFRLLIIDDNPAIHDDIRKILQPNTPNFDALDALESELFGREVDTPKGPEFEIDSAYQGKEGYEKIVDAIQGNRPYSLAFVDMRMPPGWDGIETITRIWRDDPFIQVVICTAYSDHSWSDIVERLGQNDRFLILKKPFDSIEIVQTVHALTHKWMLHNQVQLKINHLKEQIMRRSKALEEVNIQLKNEIAERERTEADLRLAQKLEAIGQLAAGIAHEINTPMQFVGDNIHFLADGFEDLRALLGVYQEACREFTLQNGEEQVLTRLKEAEQSMELEYLDEEIPAAFEGALHGITRVSNIVRAMKEFSHPDLKQMKPSDLNEAVKNTLIVARNEYKYVADIEADYEEMPPVVCYLGDLQQVFLNLIINAAHAIGESCKDTGKRGLIRLQTRNMGDMVQIIVSDNGCGIPLKERSRVFDPFFTTKNIGKGTGQGLAIAYKIVVEKHGGTIKFESEEGVGTTFYVTLPVNGQEGNKKSEKITRSN